MDRETMMKAMTASISEVLETMFFLTVDVVPAEKGGLDTGPGSDEIAVRLDFFGPICGCVYLQVPASLAEEISADFMGVDSMQVTPEQMRGTVKEMVNMLTGNTLSVYDPDAVFDISVPEIVAIGKDPIGDLVADTTIRLNLDTLSDRMVMALSASDKEKIDV